MNIPAKLKLARLEQGYTIKQTAELVGINPQTYSCYERGITTPRSGIIAKLCKTLNIDENYLLSDSDELRNINAYIQ
jgi:transcriptional regulator with XRE-family HTH domain